MTASSDVPLSKGMMMIAAYREARLRQRPVLRTSLHETHVARRAARCQGQVAGEPACMTAVEAPAPAPVATAAPEAAEPASVFANLVSLAVSENLGVSEKQTVSDKQTENTEAPADNMAAVAQDSPPDVMAVAPLDEAAVAPLDVVAAASPDDAAAAPTEPVEPVSYDPPLAEIGFGPGMLIRLSQLGLRTTGDLAHADANALRAALGDISRLVDVEAWIASARMTASTAPTDFATTPEVYA